MKKILLLLFCLVALGNIIHGKTLEITKPELKLIGRNLLFFQDINSELNYLSAINSLDEFSESTSDVFVHQASTGKYWFYFSFKKQIYREQTTYQRQIQNQITIFGIKSQFFIQIDFLCQRIRGPPGCFLDNIAALIDETGNPSVCRTGYPTPVLYRP